MISLGNYLPVAFCPFVDELTRVVNSYEQGDDWDRRPLVDDVNLNKLIGPYWDN